MPFQSLHTDTVYLQKPDSSRLGPYKTRVTSESASIFDANLDIDPGDTLIRELPNNKEETYLVLSADYSSGLGGAIPPHYSLKLRKEATIRVPPHPTNQTTVNISQSNGIQVGDHNTLVIQNALTEMIQKIDAAPGTSEDKAEAKGRLAAFLAHPTVGAVLGSVASAALGALLPK